MVPPPPHPLFLWINVSSLATEYLPGKGLSDILKCFYFPRQYISITFIISSVSFFSNFCSNYMILGSTSLGFSVDSGDANSRTLLMNAAVNGKVQVVKGLIKREADLCLMNNGERNLLQHAALGGNPEIIALMLTHVPNIESRCAENLSPLMIPVVNGN